MHPELLLWRLRFALASSGYSISFYINAECDEISTWLQSYQGAAGQAAGMTVMLSRFHPHPGLLGETLTAMVIGKRLDKQASEDWGEPTFLMEPLGAVTVVLEPRGGTDCTITWDEPVGRWARECLVALLAEMAQRWPDICLAMPGLPEPPPASLEQEQPGADVPPGPWDVLPAPWMRKIVYFWNTTNLTKAECAKRAGVVLKQKSLEVYFNEWKKRYPGVILSNQERRRKLEARSH